MKLFHALSLCSLVVLGINACSGGGGRVIGGNQCPANYQPIDMVNVDPNFKVSLKPDAANKLALKPGAYVYHHADLYYVDDFAGPDENYRIHIRDTRQEKDGSFKGTVECVRNAKPGMGDRGIAMSTEGLASLSLDSDSKLITDPSSPLAPTVKGYGFSMNDRGQLTINFNQTAQKPSDPSSVYGKPEIDQNFAYLHPDNTDVLDVRSTGKTKGGTWYLMITFVRQDVK